MVKKVLLRNLNKDERSLEEGRTNKGLAQVNKTTILLLIESLKRKV
jgi:hypothetical protein